MQYKAGFRKGQLTNMALWSSEFLSYESAIFVSMFFYSLWFYQSYNYEQNESRLQTTCHKTM